MSSRSWQFLPLLAVGLFASGYPACQPTGTSAVPAPKGCGFTVLFQNDLYGEIEPCG